MIDLDGDGNIDPVEFGVAESMGWLDDDDDNGGDRKPPGKKGGPGCGCLTLIVVIAVIAGVIGVAGVLTG